VKTHLRLPDLDRQEPKRPRRLKVTGFLAVRKGQGGTVDSASIAGTDADVYHIVLDERGTQLAEQMARTKVVVEGRVAYEGGDAFLTIKKFREARNNRALLTGT
jgi:hypothetical protein